MPLPSVVFSKIATARDGIDRPQMPGQLTRQAIAAQPDWLSQCLTAWGTASARGRRVLFTGCGTSFHAALACGRASQALEIVLEGAGEADVLVAISHEGGTRLTLEAVRGFPGETWLITGAAESALAKEVDHVVVATPAIEESYCHTVSYTCAVAAGRALQGEHVSALAADVFRELDAEPLGASDHDRFVVAGAGRDQATVLEAVLKLREGAHVAAEAHHTEQLLHGHLAAIDQSVRCVVLEGEGARRRARSRRHARTGRARLRRTPRADDAPGRRHRALPAADLRSGRGPRHRPRHDPVGRGALGQGTPGAGLDG
jgi:glucosamine 6-phosphate synthetase-like amidotransferase/phosphosugar isomerase protein